MGHDVVQLRRDARCRSTNALSQDVASSSLGSQLSRMRGSDAGSRVRPVASWNGSSQVSASVPVCTEFVYASPRRYSKVQLCGDWNGWDAIDMHREQGE